MNRSFTTREKILLVVLTVLLLGKSEAKRS